MSTINLYILRQSTTPLIIATLVALLMLLTERMLRLLDLVLDSNGSLKILLEMLAFLLPHYVALALPVAFFLGVLFAFSGMHQRNELDALESAGVGLHTLLKPVLVLALILTMLSLLNASLIQPYSRYLYRSLVHYLAGAATTAYLQDGVFLEVDGYTFVAEKISRNRNLYSKVFIYDESLGGGSRAITAKESRVASITGKQGKSILKLAKGETIRIKSQSSGLVKQIGTDFTVLTFDGLQLQLNLGAPQAFRDRGIDERELTLPELWSRRNNPPSDATTEEIFAEFSDRLVRIISVFFLPFLAIGFAITPPRTHRAYNILFGILVLIVYNEVVRVGKISASAGQIPMLIGQWLPLLIFVVLSIYLFARQVFSATRSGTLNWIITRLEELRRFVWRNSDCPKP